MNIVTIQGDPLLSQKPFHLAVNGAPILIGEKDRIIVDTVPGEFGCRVTISFFAHIVRANIVDKNLSAMEAKPNVQEKRAEYVEAEAARHQRILDAELP